jgi:hypothetical protein
MARRVYGITKHSFIYRCEGKNQFMKIFRLPKIKKVEVWSARYCKVNS